MPLTPVTDPTLLAQLNAQASANPPDPNATQGPRGLTPVTDPALLAQLNAATAAPSTAEMTPTQKALDVAKGVGRGLENGVEALVGLPGDAERGADWLFDKTMPSANTVRGWFGKQPLTDEQVDALNKFQPHNFPSSSQIESAVDSAGLQVPAPTTSLGQHAENVSSFIPQALGGPESLVKNILMRGVLPGAASDAAGTLAQNVAPDLEPYARMAGAFVAPSGVKEAPVAKSEDLINAGSQGFNDLRSTPFAVSDGVMQGWAKNLRDDFNTDYDPRGFSEKTAPQTHAFLQNIANQQGAFHQDDLDAINVGFQNLVDSTSGRDQTAAIAAKNAFANRMATPFTQGQTLIGDPNAIAKTWSDANANYAAGKRLESIEQTAQRSQDQAFAANSGAGSGNKLRGAFANLVNNDNAMLGFTPDEQNAIRNLAHGSWAQNFVRNLSNRIGGGGGLGSLAAMEMIGSAGGVAGYEQDGGVGGTLGGLGGALGTYLLAKLSRGVYNRSVDNAVDQMARVVASRAPLAQGTGPLSAINAVRAQRSLAARMLNKLKAASAANVVQQSLNALTNTNTAGGQ